MVWTRKSKRLLIPFFTWVFTGDPISTKWPHRALVELMLLVCRSIGSNHIWYLVWISFPWFYFSPPQRGRDFYSPSSDHLKLVQFKRVCFVREHPRLFGILQYFCLKSWFISSTSWKFCTLYAYIYVLGTLIIETFEIGFCNISAYNHIL